MASARDTLTPLELEIMQVLWDGEAATVAEVQARHGGRLAYTTVQTMLGVLLKKKKVRRSLSGRAYVYRPAISREGAAAGAITDLVSRMFGGSAEALLMTLIDARQIGPAELARASSLLNKKDGDDE